MTYDQYWHDTNPTTFWAYREAYLYKERVKAEEELNRDNMAQWLGGQYIGMMISQIISGKETYPKKPFNFEELKKQKELNEEYEKSKTLEEKRKFHAMNRRIIMQERMSKFNKLKEKKG